MGGFASRDVQLAISGLLGCDNAEGRENEMDKRLDGRPRCAIALVTTCHMEECDPQDIRVGNHHFNTIACGDQLWLTEDLKVKFGTWGANWEKNQCAIIAYAAGVGWKLQGCPSRRPGIKRVEFIATQLREREFRRSGETSPEIARRSYSIGRGGWRLSPMRLYPMRANGIWVR